MEDNNYQLNQQLEEINRIMLEDIKAVTDKINQKINTTKEELKKCIDDKKDYYKLINDLSKLPHLQTNFSPNQDINYIINPVLVCLANLEVIFKFCKGKERKEVLIRINQLVPQSFLIYFIQLMEQMRDEINKRPHYKDLHLYLKNPHLKFNYNSQDPSYWIKIILEQLELNIDLVKGNDISNIITNNFKLNLITKEKCNYCKSIDKTILKEEKIVLDLYLKSPGFDENTQIRKNLIDPLESIFGSLLLKSEEQNLNKKCGFCGQQLSITKIIKNKKNYLILNINRDEERERKMELIYSQILKITDEETKEEIHYELISVLANINVNSNNEGNRNNYVLYFKNFINDKWFRWETAFNDNIEKEISEQKPNILIYKKM